MSRDQWDRLGMGVLLFVCLAAVVVVYSAVVVP